MESVDSERLRPLVDYLTRIYDDNLYEVSEVSGIDYRVLHGIVVRGEGAAPSEAQKVVDFLMQHKRRPLLTVFSSYEEPVKPRFLSPRQANLRERELRVLAKEKKKLGY